MGSGKEYEGHMACIVFLAIKLLFTCSPEHVGLAWLSWTVTFFYFCFSKTPLGDRKII